SPGGLPWLSLFRNAVYPRSRFCEFHQTRSRSGTSGCRGGAQRFRTSKFVGMEYFGSRDETTRQASLDELDRSDLYVGIMGGRYGSGITEKEYLRTRERKLACFNYLKREDAIQNDGTGCHSEADEAT